MRNLFGFAVLAVMVLAFIGWLHLEHTYRYRITVPDGRYSTSYYTNAYSQRGGCVSFLQETRHDSSQVCGMYSITRLR